MAAAGDVLRLRDGEKLTIRVPASTSGGELLEVEAEWCASDHRPPAHLHPHQAERFAVQEGELTVEMGGGESTHGAGDSFEIPAGTAHRMWNSGSGIARATWQVRPALRTEEMFAAVDALVSSGRHGAGGMLTPLGGALIAHEFSDEFRLPIPWALQRPLLTALAAVARRRGYPSP